MADIYACMALSAVSAIFGDVIMPNGCFDDLHYGTPHHVSDGLIFIVADIRDTSAGSSSFLAAMALYL